MDIPKEFYDMVCADIKEIENSENYSFQELIRLHRRVDARYQACIKDWYIGFWGSNGSQIFYHSISMADARDNLLYDEGKTRNVQIPDECGTVAQAGSFQFSGRQCD